MFDNEKIDSEKNVNDKEGTKEPKKTIEDSILDPKSTDEKSIPEKSETLKTAIAEMGATPPPLPVRSEAKLIANKITDSKDDTKASETTVQEEEKDA